MPESGIETAIFQERLNRFVIRCRLGARRVRCYLPNPGRLWELLLPGAEILLEPAPPSSSGLPYRAVAVRKEGHPVMIDTHRANDLARLLIAKGMVPGLEGAMVVRREVKVGGSRLDFLLQKGRERILLEVKSCTLYTQTASLFPDAVTARARRQVEELVRWSRGGGRSVLLFLIYWPRAQFFLPEYHTDLEFARAILDARPDLEILPLALDLREDLTPGLESRLLRIPWEMVEREARDRGGYMVLLRLKEEVRIGVGRLGTVSFPAGHYLYVGSAEAHLSRRIERHRRRRKRLFWHLDYFRQVADFRLALPFRTAERVECHLARAVEQIADWAIPGFGTSDCACSSHLLGMKGDPLQRAEFIALLQYFRVDRMFAP